MRYRVKTIGSLVHRYIVWDTVGKVKVGGPFRTRQRARLACAAKNSELISIVPGPGGRH